MYFTARMIQEVANHYGYPPIIRLDAPISQQEFDFIRSTQSFGRCHDLTFYIFKNDKIIVNAKHHYPPGLFRAPSGGLKPGEDFHDGAYREIYEETGVKVELRRYILQVHVNFLWGKRVIPWRSHVFTARYISGRLRPVDIREIREVALADLSDFEKYKKIIGNLESGGLHYRARLHDEVVRFL